MKGARFAAAASRVIDAPVRISSNVSALGFRTAHIAEKIVECLDRSGFPADCLTLEVTESVLVENIASANESLSNLRASGIRIALDDFGAGYSSLRYLQQLVFDEIKIDRSFLQNITNDNEKHFLFLKIVEMAKGLHKEVVVEGIETQAHVQENGRITIMFCAFEGPANIVRLYGKGEAIDFDHPDYPDMLAKFPGFDRARAIIKINVTRISDSCGWGVPFYDFKGERDQLKRWVDNISDDAEWRERRYNRNAESIDGLAGLKGKTT